MTRVEDVAAERDVASVFPATLSVEVLAIINSDVVGGV